MNNNNKLSGLNFGCVVAKLPKIKPNIADKRALVDFKNSLKMNGTKIEKLSKDTIKLTNKNAPDEFQADVWTEIFLNKIGVKNTYIKDDPRTLADKVKSVRILNNHMLGEEIFD